MIFSQYHHTSYKTLRYFPALPLHTGCCGQVAAP